MPHCPWFNTGGFLFVWGRVYHETMQRKTVTKGNFSLNYYEMKHSEIFTQLAGLIPKKTTPVQWVTMHWTAGSYYTNYPSYQILIDPDNVLVSPTPYTWAHHGHTYHRNSYNIGISFKAMANANYPVTKEMMRAAGKVCYTLKKNLGLQWAQFKDHDYFSKIDGYDSLRWDVQLKLADAEARAIGKASETVFERVLRYAKEEEKQASAKPAEVKKENVKVEPEKLYPKLEGTPFTDVDPQRYSAPAIVHAYEQGWLAGHKLPDGGQQFKPSAPLLREEFAVAQKKFAETLGLANRDKKDPEHPFYAIAKRLYEKGVIPKKGDDHMGQPVFELFEQIDYGTLLGLFVGFSDNMAELQQLLSELKGEF